MSIQDMNPDTIVEKAIDENPQILSEESMRDRKKSDRRPSKSGGNISALKRRLDSASAKNAELSKRLEKRLTNTPTVKLKEDSISLEYNLDLDGHAYKDELPVANGEIVHYLAPFLEPVIRIVNAALSANDLRNLQPAFQQDNLGKPLRDKPLRAEDGERLFRTNPVDDLRAVWANLEANRGVMNALGQVYNELANVDLQKIPLLTTRTRHASKDMPIAEPGLANGEQKDYRPQIRADKGPTR